MKIFISHSSKDKWAARRISEDLEKLGGKTFLDEKDIRTGQSLDESIKKNLKNSDHFLILISPSSVKSEWVLVELGGAIALERTIIPILLYVGVNEVPHVINLKLARDINEIDRYYEEVKSAITGKKLEPKKVIKLKSKFKIGDKVRITETKPIDVYRNEGLIADWEEPMNSSLGKVAGVTEDYKDGSYGLDINEYLYAEEWLTKV